MGNSYVISAELDLATADLGQIVKRDSIDGFRENLDADLLQPSVSMLTLDKFLGYSPEGYAICQIVRRLEEI
jgi:hypothetical protein